MIARSLHLFLSLAGLGLLAAGAPRGKLLVPAPERGAVTATQPGTRSTVRGRGPVFMWLGGGYHGGK